MPGKNMTPCPPRELLPCPVCGHDDPGRASFPVRVECPRCGLTVCGPSGVEVQRWNRLAGLRLALERIAVLPVVAPLKPLGWIDRQPEALARHVAAIAREALDHDPSA